MIKKLENDGMNIRPYAESDLAQLEKLDSFAVLEIKYHGGVKDENIFCAVNNDEMIGAGMLTLFQESRVEFSVYSDDPAVKEMLINRLIERFIELQKESEHKMVLRACRFSDKLEEIQLLLSKGFRADNVIMCMKYDLSEEIAQYVIPDEIEIKPHGLSGESMPEYLKCAEQSGLIPMKDFADVWFRTGAPGFTCFAAFHGGKIIGSATILDISEQCGATEFIFVLPLYRRNNIARQLIATALAELKNRGKKEASLTVYGMNLPAVNLYLSIGYYLTGNVIELNYFA